MATVKETFPVLQMGCAACAARVVKALQEAPGVASAAVNFASAEVTVAFDPAATSPEGLRDVVRKAGYDLVITAPEATPEALDERQKKK